MNMVTDVIDFNSMILEIEPRPKALLSQEEINISLRCLTEEAQELGEAHYAKDYVGCVDAVLDSVYFSFGILYKLGLTADEIERSFAAIHLANMTKERGVNSKRATGAADAVKPEGWMSPEERIKEILGV